MMTRHPIPGFEFTTNEKTRIDFYRADISAKATMEAQEMLVKLTVEMMGQEFAPIQPSAEFIQQG